MDISNLSDKTVQSLKLRFKGNHGIYLIRPIKKKQARRHYHYQAPNEVPTLKSNTIQIKHTSMI